MKEQDACKIFYYEKSRHLEVLFLFLYNTDIMYVILKHIKLKSSLWPEMKDFQFYKQNILKEDVSKLIQTARSEGYGALYGEGVSSFWTKYLKRCVTLGPNS